MSALTAGKQVRKLASGADDYAPIKASEIIYAGGIMMLDTSGRALNGVAATGCIGVGLALTNQGLDRWDGTGLSDAALSVKYDEGIFLCANSVGDALAAGDEGKICYIENNQTVAKTANSGTLSPAGRVYRVDTEGVWVAMGKLVAKQVAEELGMEPGTVFTQTYSTASTTVVAVTYTALTGSNSGTANGALEAEGTLSTAGGNTYTDAAVNTILAKIENNITELNTVVAQVAADNLLNRKLINGLIDLLQAAGIAG